MGWVIVDLGVGFMLIMYVYNKNHMTNPALWAHGRCFVRRNPRTVRPYHHAGELHVYLIGPQMLDIRWAGIKTDLSEVSPDTNISKTRHFKVRNFNIFIGYCQPSTRRTAYT